MRHSRRAVRPRFLLLVLSLLPIACRPAPTPHWAVRCVRSHTDTTRVWSSSDAALGTIGQTPQGPGVAEGLGWFRVVTTGCDQRDSVWTRGPGRTDAERPAAAPSVDAAGVDATSPAVWMITTAPVTVP